MQNKFLVPVAVLSVVLIGAFGSNLHQDKQQVHELTLATGTKTGTYYPFGKAMAEVVMQQNPRLRIKVVETQGAEENMGRLQANQAQLAIVQNNTAPLPEARVIASLFKEIFHLIVSEQSGIQSVSDLKGKNIALMAKGSGSYSSFWLVSKHYGLKASDFQFTAGSWTQATKLFASGEADAIFRVLPLGSDLVSDLLRNTQAKFVPIDQAAAIKIKGPYLEADVIPKGTYKGDPAVPDTDLSTVGVQATLLVRKDVDPVIVKEITRILFENRRNLVAANSLAAQISQPSGSGGFTLPIHEGAQAYYDREKPDFLAANSDVIGLSFSFFTLFASWLWQLRARFLQRRKKRSDKFNSIILNLIQRIRKARNIEEIDRLQEELFVIFKQVMGDLDKDRINSDAFHSFTFTWETALKFAAEREKVLRNLSPVSHDFKADFTAVKKMEK